MVIRPFDRPVCQGAASCNIISISTRSLSGWIRAAGVPAPRLPAPLTYNHSNNAVTAEDPTADCTPPSSRTLSLQPWTHLTRHGDATHKQAAHSCSHSLAQPSALPIASAERPVCMRSHRTFFLVRDSISLKPIRRYNRMARTFASITDKHSRCTFQVCRRACRAAPAMSREPSRLPW